MKLLFLALVANLFAEICCITRSRSEAKRDILNQILPTSPNEILVAPGNGSDGPTVVEIYLHVKNIDNINEEKMELTSRLYLRQIWKDTRLQYDGNKNQISSIVINDPNVIWTPDIYISNIIKGHSSDLLRPNVFIRIFPDGTVLYSKGISITTSCPMDLRKFPFDNQACDVYISTYGSTMDDVILKWRYSAATTISKNLHTPLLSLESFWSYSRVASVTTGNYSVLVLSFLFKRELTHYTIHIFVPCAMLVILSWASLWISRKKLYLRLLLDLSALVAWTVLVCSHNKDTVRTSYITSMNCFVGTCCTMIFIAIIESIVVYLLGEEADNARKIACDPVGGIERTKFYDKWIRKIAVWGDKIDCWARFIIPLIFILFSAVYFYMGSNRQTNDSLTGQSNHTLTSGLKI